MGTLFDYLDWRGDLRFSEAELNEIDGLILSLITYIDFDGIVPTVIVAADKVVVADDAGFRTSDRNRLRSGRMAVIPAVGSNAGVVNVAAFNNDSPAITYIDGSVEVDSVSGRLFADLVKTSVVVTSLLADHTPAADIAVGNADIIASVDLNDVLVAAFDGKFIEYHIACAIKFDDGFEKFGIDDFSGL